MGSDAELVEAVAAFQSGDGLAVEVRGETEQASARLFEPPD